MSCCNTCQQPVRVCCCPTPTPTPPVPPPVPECISPIDYLFDISVITDGPCINENCKSPMEYFFEQVFANQQPGNNISDIIQELLNTGIIASNITNICCENCCLENNKQAYFLGSADIFVSMFNLYSNKLPCCLNTYASAQSLLKLVTEGGITLQTPCTDDFQTCATAISALTDSPSDILNIGVFESGNSQAVSYFCTLGNILTGITPALTSNEYTTILDTILSNGFIVSCNLIDNQIFIGGYDAYEGWYNSI